jgi:hypothetical protein
MLNCLQRQRKMIAPPKPTRSSPMRNPQAKITNVLPLTRTEAAAKSLPENFVTAACAQ